MKRPATVLTLALTVLGIGVLSGTAGGAAADPGPAPGEPSTQLPVHDLAVRNTDFPRYRIPGMTTTSRGTVVAAYDGRPTMGDVPSDIAMLVRRSTDGGRTWGSQQVVRQDDGPNGYGDPSLLTDRTTGRIFLFHAASVNQGFAGSHTGNSDTDPDILQMDYSWSDDDGVTWAHRRLTSEAKNPAWGGLFASSGEGIQLREGPYAGRLLQQYVVRYDGKNYAATLYSDDHGASWQFGKLVGPGMDENKTVELSDGTVMLNSRAPGGLRKVAYSHDGGVTYGEPKVDQQLVDPANNGSIMRLHPDAPASDPRSQMLLFSNTEDSSLRRNLTVKMSCDNGRTWPIRRVVEPRASGYSTLTRLPDGDLGLLFEREGYQKISFSRFDADWLGGVCAPLDVNVPDQLQAGESGTIEIGITNQTGRTLGPGRAIVTLPQGWFARAATVGRLAPGEERFVKVRVVAAADAATGFVDGTVSYSSGGRVSQTAVRLSVNGAGTPPRPALEVTAVLDAVYPAGGPGILGDEVAPVVRVTNTGNVSLSGVALTGNADHLEDCELPMLQPGQSADCRTARHVITIEDQASGSYTPTLTVTGRAPDGVVVTATARTERVDLSG